jgi:di/tripeptidase
MFLSTGTMAFMNSLTQLTPAQLRKVADVQEKIEALTQRLGQLLGAETATPTEEPAKQPKRKRHITEAGRKAMSLAGKRRWAKARAAMKPRT